MMIHVEDIYLHIKNLNCKNSDFDQNRFTEITGISIPVIDRLRHATTDCFLIIRHSSAECKIFFEDANAIV